MGNQQSYMCDNCSPMQVEDTQYDEHRMTFQMTKMRQFSHYSRDFQVEQKFNRIVTSKPGYQLSLELVYPSRLDYLKAQLVEKSGKDRKIDEEDDDGDQYRFDRVQGSNGKMKKQEKQDDKEKIEIQEILGVKGEQGQQQQDKKDQGEGDNEGQDIEGVEDNPQEEEQEDENPQQEEEIDEDQNDSSAEIYYKSFKLGNVELDCNILCNEFEVMYEQCVVDSTEITQRAAKTDVFIFLLDDEMDLPLCDYVVQLISQSCQKHAVVFLAAAKSVTSISFLAGYSTLIAENVQEHEIMAGQGQQQDDEKIPQLNKFFKNQKENARSQQQLKEPLILRDSDHTTAAMKTSPVRKERTVLQKWVKSIIDNYWNTDFVLFDFDSSETINAQFEVILAQAIYSQDSQFNQQI